MVPLISRVLAERGIDASKLLVEVGLPAEAIRGEVTAPLGRIQKLVDLAARRADNPVFGLELASVVPHGAFGIAEFLMRSAPSVKKAIEVLCDFAPLINPIGTFRHVITPEGGELHYGVLAQRDALGRHLNEYTIALIVRQFGAALGAPLPLARAWFPHARPAAADVVAQRLGTTVAFQSADCGIAVTHEVLERRPRTADPPLFEFLLAQAHAQLAYVGTHDVVSRVVRAIEMRLPHGDLDAAAIAAALATTVRSLQRHLAEAGTSYRDVLAYVRNRRRAELARGGFSQTEIARALGFTDARSMRRSLDRDREA